MYFLLTNWDFPASHVSFSNLRLTFQGTITYPTKREVRKTINSNIPFPGPGDMLHSSLEGKHNKNQWLEDVFPIEIVPF